MTTTKKQSDIKVARSSFTLIALLKVEIGLRLLFVLATEHTFLRIFLNIWYQILLMGDLHDTAF